MPTRSPTEETETEAQAELRPTAVELTTKARTARRNRRSQFDLAATVREPRRPVIYLIFAIDYWIFISVILTNLSQVHAFGCAGQVWLGHVSRRASVARSTGLDSTVFWEPSWAPAGFLACSTTRQII